MIVCPLCNENVNDTSRAKGLHAQLHKISSEDFFVFLHCAGTHPTCECSRECSELVTWRGWKHGFLKQKRGHFSKKQIEDRTKALVETMAGDDFVHWTKKEEHQQVVLDAAEKRRTTMKNLFQHEGQKIWCDGLTKDTNLSLQRASEKRSKNHRRETHWHWDSLEDLKEKILPVLGENFFVEDFTKLDVNVACKVSVACRRCAFVKETTVYNVVRTDGQYRCHRCDHFQSAAEKELGEFVKSIIDNEEIVFGDRSVLKKRGWELDVYVPSKHIAVEFNGLYWHSELQNDDKHYHQSKTDECRVSGVHLLHVFEDEWSNKKAIVKSMISYRVGAIKRRLHARKCSVRELTVSERKKFFDNTHLDGDANATISFGLLQGTDIVSAISLRKLFRKNSKGKIEIARFSNALDTVVSGALSRLLSTCEEWSKKNDIDTIVTYVDMRLGTGVGYEKVGFEKTGTTAERFWYTNGSIRLGRLIMRARDNESELERSIQKRVARIYGCKNIVLEKVIK